MAAKKNAVRRARKATTPKAPKRRAAKRTRRDAKKSRRSTRKARRGTKPKAPKTTRKASKSKATRKTVRKARRASTPKAPKSRRATKAKRVAKRKAKKPKRVTKKSQTGKMWQVWAGTRTWTVGGLTKDDLMLNKRGKVVSKKTHAVGQRAYVGAVQKWSSALAKARAELEITGFVTINRGETGIKLYKLAKKYHAEA